MNSIIDFIKTNWIWLVVIVLITIITIIGFLADKKKNSKKEEIEKEPNSNDIEIEEQNNIEKPTNEPVNNGFGLNINNMDTTIRPISENSNNMSNNEQINNNINGITPLTPNINNQINNLGTDRVQVENVNPNVTQNNAYQKPITNFGDNPNNQEMYGNQITAPQNQNNYQNVITPNATMQQPNYGQTYPTQVNNVGTPQNQMPNQYPNINNQNRMNQSMPTGNNQYNNNPHFNQNNTTIPTPVNQIPTPQPVRPQPIMNGINNNSQMMNPNFDNNLSNQQMNPSVPTEQNRITNNNIPVNFVFGPQNNNNQNM